MENNKEQPKKSQPDHEKKGQMNGSAGGKPEANGNCQFQSADADCKLMSNGNGVAGQQSSEAGAAICAALADDPGTLLPHLESIERLMKLPVVEATWNQGQDVYDKVKGEIASQNDLLLVWFLLRFLRISPEISSDSVRVCE